MDKYWIFGAIAIFLIIIIGGIIITIQKEAIEEICKGKEVCQVNFSSSYQGAVPEGYDLTHFRKTGETIPLKKYKEVTNGK